MSSALIFSAIAVFLFMQCAFVLSVIRKRNDLADIVWGIGFVVLAWLFFPFAHPSIRSFVVTMLVTLWGLRLSFHIALRHKNKPEDERYAAWRRTWKYFTLRSYVQIYLLQGLLLWIIAMPILAIHTSPYAALHWLDVVGLIVWIIGFGCEVIADKQLKAFLSHPAHKGKIMQTGLWRYSRHPNYFGEVTAWWGIFLMAVSVPQGILTIISPLMITALILFVSGVPMLERKYAGRPDFEEYKKRTSVFFPLPPR